MHHRMENKQTFNYNYRKYSRWDLELDQWDLEWKLSTVGRQKSISDSFLTEDKIIYRLQRKDQVTITRIRIGHTKGTHSFMMTKNPNPRCEICNFPFSIDHLVLTSLKYILV